MAQFMVILDGTGLLIVGLWVGLSFISVSVSAMSQVRHEIAGVASGFLSTAHEVGGAFGIAVFSTVSLGGASSLASFAGGYDRGLVTGACIAAGFALVALVTFPSFKPTEIQQVSVH